MRPMAESRRSSSNSSRVKVRNCPRSPRNVSRVRGRRPSTSAKFWRSTSSTCAATRSLSDSVWRTMASNSRRTTSTSSEAPASCSASRPMRRARQTSAGRSSTGRSRTKVASPPSTRRRRSMTMCSPVRPRHGSRTHRPLGASWTMLAASMRPSVMARCDSSCVTALGYPRDDARPCRPWCFGWGRVHAAARRGVAFAWPRCDGHRSSAAQGGAGSPGLPGATRRPPGASGRS